MPVMTKMYYSSCNEFMKWCKTKDNRTIPVSIIRGYVVRKIKFEV